MWADSSVSHPSPAAASCSSAGRRWTLSPRSCARTRPYAPDVNVQPYNDDIVDVTASLSEVHAALKPYLAACMKEAEEGIPVMRPDFYECGDYSASREEYAYFLGGDVFVAPVIEKGAETREVTLPAGDWVKFFDGTEHKGGTKERFAAPLGKPVAFYRKGSAFAPLFAGITL